MSRALGAALALIALSACENADQPLSPAWGKERCGSCSMVVGDDRFAAQLVKADGQRLFFDDPGCLAAYRLAHPAPAHAWVLSEGQWLSVEVAHFSDGARTPMDYGFEARHDGKLGWASVEQRARAPRAGAN